MMHLKHNSRTCDVYVCTEILQKHVSANETPQHYRALSAVIVWDFDMSIVLIRRLNNNPSVLDCTSVGALLTFL